MSKDGTKRKTLALAARASIFVGMIIPERIQAARANKGWTQEGLAERMGLSAGFGKVQVSHWENNRKAPSARNLVRLADALGVSVDYLLGVESDR